MFILFVFSKPIEKFEIDIINPSDPNIINKLDASTYLIQLPSGKDLRAFPSDGKFSLSLTWEDPSTGSLSIPAISDIGTANLADGGLKFTSGNPTGWTTPSITVSPVTFEYKIRDMSDIITSDDITQAVGNPFRSRETSVTFEPPANDCEESAQVTVRFNQTNFKMIISPYNANLYKYGYRLRSKTELHPSASGVMYFRYLITK